MRNKLPNHLSWLGRAAVGLLVLTTAASAQAQASGGSSEIKAAPAGGRPAAAEAAVKAPAPPPRLEAIVRGFFVGARLGGGYMVLGAELDQEELPQLNGLDEGYGPGSMLQVEIGYDLGSALAIEAVGGASVIAGTRSEWVRDLGLAYGGLALRLAPGLTDRLRFALMAGGGYAVADNAVEPQEKGPATFGSVGLEYYVHVRHFSIGLDVTVVAPLNPLRVFVGVGPQVKYTF